MFLLTERRQVQVGVCYVTSDGNIDALVLDRMNMPIVAGNSDERRVAPFNGKMLSIVGSVAKILSPTVGEKNRGVEVVVVVCAKNSAQ